MRCKSYVERWCTLLYLFSAFSLSPLSFLVRFLTSLSSIFIFVHFQTPCVCARSFISLPFFIFTFLCCFAVLMHFSYFFFYFIFLSVFVVLLLCCASFLFRIWLTNILLCIVFFLDCFGITGIPYKKLLMFKMHAIFIDISSRFYLLHECSYFQIECDILPVISEWSQQQTIVSTITFLVQQSAGIWIDPWFFWANLVAN